MQTLAEAPTTGTTNPALHPSYLSWAREGALILIKDGTEVDSLSRLAEGDRENIADAIEALRAEGVGPRQAETLLARLKKPGLRVIPGGGEPPETPARPALLLLTLAGAR